MAAAAGAAFWPAQFSDRQDLAGDRADASALGLVQGRKQSEPGMPSACPALLRGAALSRPRLASAGSSLFVNPIDQRLGGLTPAMARGAPVSLGSSEIHARALRYDCRITNSYGVWYHRRTSSALLSRT